MKERKRFSWLWAWLIQIFGFLILNSLVINVAPYLGPAMGAVYWGYMWVAVPVLGLLSSYWATRRGLLNYLSWVAPPSCHWVCPMIWMGYPPDAMCVVICSLVSLVGAAAGEVMNQREESASREEKK